MLSDAANFTKSSKKAKSTEVGKPPGYLKTSSEPVIESATQTEKKSTAVFAPTRLAPRILKRYGSQVELIDRFADILQEQEKMAYQVGHEFNILVSGGAGGDKSVAMKLLAATLLRYHHHRRRALAAEPAYFKNLCDWNIFFADERCVAQFDNESFFEMFYEWAYETVIQYPKHPEVHDVYHYPKPAGPAKIDLAPEYLKESKPARYDESVLDMLKRYETTIDEIVPKGLHPVTDKPLPRFDLVLLDLDSNGSVGGLISSTLEAESNGYLQLVTDVSPPYFTTALPLLETASNVFVFVDPVAAAAKTGVAARVEQQEQEMADTFERILKPTTPADLELPAARLYRGRQGNVEFFVHLGIHKRL
jgi:6-phosphogluconolactonase/glucosamine-6-phosphate isomerase/deaminase